MLWLLPIPQYPYQVSSISTILVHLYCHTHTDYTNSNESITDIKLAADDQKGESNSMQKSGKKHQDRSALFDITNDSPIVGLAMGNLSTPSSGFSKKRSVISNQCSNNNIGSTTPGSGEALLRSQVKSLLQKVEEEGEIFKFSLEDGGGPFVHLKGLLANSPMAFLAPTPTNTPSVYGTQRVEKIGGLVSGISTPILEQVSITKVCSCAIFCERPFFFRIVQ